MPMNFRDALLKTIKDRGLSLKEVCEAAGVSYEQGKKMKQRKPSSTNVDDAVKLASALGLTVNELLQDDLSSDRIELARLYSQLSEPERRMLRVLAQAPGALRPPEGTE